MNSKEVFISYHSSEFDQANWVKSVLEQNGISCWLAPGSIPGGSSYAVEIPNAIRNCKVFVLLLSQKSQESKWVPREVDQAINNGKTILPFMIENCALKDDFNFYLSNIQRYEAYVNKSSAMERMIKEIKSIIAAKTESEPKMPEINFIAPNPADEVKPADVKADPAAPAPEKKEKKTAEKKEKPVKVKKEREPKKAAGASDGKKTKKIIAVAVPVLALIIGAVLLFTLLGKGGADKAQPNNGQSQTGTEDVRPDSSSSESDETVTICGTDFNIHEDKAVELEGVTVKQEDIDNMAKLNSLFRVSLTSCDIQATSLSPLNDTQLYRLIIDDCGITESLFSSFSGAEVYDLSLKNNNITDISFLANITKLNYLYLDGNKIGDLSGLSGFEKIYKLSVNNCGLTSLAGIEHCLELEEIYASGNELSDLSGMENVTILKKADLSSNKLTSLPYLSKSAAKLTFLMIQNNELTSLNDISTCTLITDLNVSDNKLTSLEGISGMTNLVNLAAARNNIETINELSEDNNYISYRLCYLDLSGNKISDISPLDTSGMPLGVKESDSASFILSDNNITDLPFIKSNITVLAIDGNDISDLSSINDSSFKLDTMKISKLIFNYSEKIDYSPLKDRVNAFYLIGCPLDKQLSISDTLGKYSTNMVTADDEEVLQIKANAVPYSWRN